MVKGWGGYREGTKFEFRWGQKMKKIFTYQKKGGWGRFTDYLSGFKFIGSVVLEVLASFMD